MNQQRMPEQVPLGALLANWVHASHERLHDTIEACTRIRDSNARRNRLLSYFEHSRQQLIRLLVVVKWVRRSRRALEGLEGVVQVLQERDLTWQTAIQKLMQVQQQVDLRLYPVWDVDTAVHVLATGSYELLPAILNLPSSSSSSSSSSGTTTTKTTEEEDASERAALQARLNHRIRLELVASHLPSYVKSVAIEKGIARLTIPGLVVAGLTLRMPSSSPSSLDQERKEDEVIDRVYWQLVEVKFLLQRKGEIPLVNADSPLLRSLVHASSIVNVNLRKPQHSNSVSLQRMCERLCSICACMTLDVLHFQATQSTSKKSDASGEFRGLLGEGVWLEYKQSPSRVDQTELVVHYWPDFPSPPPSLASSSLSSSSSGSGSGGGAGGAGGAGETYFSLWMDHQMRIAVQHHPSILPDAVLFASNDSNDNNNDNNDGGVKQQQQQQQQQQFVDLANIDIFSIAKRAVATQASSRLLAFLAFVKDAPRRYWPRTELLRVRSSDKVAQLKVRLTFAPQQTLDVTVRHEDGCFSVSSASIAALKSAGKQLSIAAQRSSTSSNLQHHAPKVVWDEAANALLLRCSMKRVVKLLRRLRTGLLSRRFARSLELPTACSFGATIAFPSSSSSSSSSGAASVSSFSSMEVKGNSDTSMAVDGEEEDSPPQFPKADSMFAVAIAPFASHFLCLDVVRHEFDEVADSDAVSVRVFWVETAGVERVAVSCDWLGLWEARLTGQQQQDKQELSRLSLLVQHSLKQIQALLPVQCIHDAVEQGLGDSTISVTSPSSLADLNVRSTLVPFSQQQQQQQQQSGEDEQGDVELEIELAHQDTCRIAVHWHLQTTGMHFTCTLSIQQQQQRQSLPQGFTEVFSFLHMQTFPLCEIVETAHQRLVCAALAISAERVLEDEYATAAAPGRAFEITRNTDAKMGSVSFLCVDTDDKQHQQPPQRISVCFPTGQSPYIQCSNTTTSVWQTALHVEFDAYLKRCETALGKATLMHACDVSVLLSQDVSLVRELLLTWTGLNVVSECLADWDRADFHRYGVHKSTTGCATALATVRALIRSPRDIRLVVERRVPLGLTLLFPQDQPGFVVAQSAALERKKVETRLDSQFKLASYTVPLDAPGEPAEEETAVQQAGSSAAQQAGGEEEEEEEEEEEGGDAWGRDRLVPIGELRPVLWEWMWRCGQLAVVPLLASCKRDGNAQGGDSKTTTTINWFADGYFKCVAAPSRAQQRLQTAMFPLVEFFPEIINKSHPDQEWVAILKSYFRERVANVPFAASHIIAFLDVMHFYITQTGVPPTAWCVHVLMWGLFDCEVQCARTYPQHEEKGSNLMFATRFPRSSTGGSNAFHQLLKDRSQQWRDAETSLVALRRWTSDTQAWPPTFNEGRFSVALQVYDRHRTDAAVMLGVQCRQMPYGNVEFGLLDIARRNEFFVVNVDDLPAPSQWMLGLRGSATRERVAPRWQEFIYRLMQFESLEHLTKFARRVFQLE